MGILVLILTVVFQLTVAAIGLFLLFLGLNGYSERQATPSLIVYIILSLASACALGAVSPFALKRLAKRTSLGSFGSSAVVVVAFSFIGMIVLFVKFFASFALAEILRANR